MGTDEMIFTEDSRLVIETTRIEWKNIRICKSVSYDGTEISKSQSQAYPEVGFEEGDLWVWAPTNDIH